MNSSRAGLRALMQSLSALLDREAREIQKRNFEGIAALLDAKMTLADQLDELSAVILSDRVDRVFSSQLQSIAAKARRNAEQLQFLHGALSNARQRLQTILDDARTTGAYARSGAAIRGAAPSRVTREA